MKRKRSVDPLYHTWLTQHTARIETNLARVRASLTPVPMMQWEVDKAVREERDALREQIKNLRIELEFRRGPRPKVLRAEQKRQLEGRCPRCAEKKPRDGRVTCAACLQALRIKRRK